MNTCNTKIVTKKEICVMKYKCIFLQTIYLALNNNFWYLNTITELLDQMNREQQWTHYDESMYQMTSCTEKSELRRQSKRSEEICVEICTLFKELIIEPRKKYFKLPWWKWNGKSLTCKPHTPLSFNKTHFQHFFRNYRDFYREIFLCINWKKNDKKYVMNMYFQNICKIVLNPYYLF